MKKIFCNTFFIENMLLCFICSWGEQSLFRVGRGSCLRIHFKYFTYVIKKELCSTLLVRLIE